MLTWVEVGRLVEHVAPVYIILLVGYVLNRADIIQPYDETGLSRWVSMLGVPFYTFHLLAFSNPYTISLRFVAADALQKFFALAFSCLWWRFAKTGNIDGVIAFFMLATLPNTVLVGEALLQPLYGDKFHGDVITIIFLQSLLWYNLCLCLYELRIVLIEMTELPVQLQSISVRTMSDPESVSSNLEAPESSSSTEDGPEAIQSDEDFDGNGVLNRSSSGSPPPRIFVSKQRSGELNTQSMRECCDKVVSPIISEGKYNKIKFGFGTFTLVGKKVFIKMANIPLTYASFLGFLYATLAFRYDWKMPYAMKTSLELISGGCVGIAIFLIGMQWARSGPQFIPCGWKALTAGMFVRFAIGPVLMVVASLSVNLRRDVSEFRFAILQAVIPQGVMSFVFAKQYDLDVNFFSAAVTFQLLVFVPIAICYFYILEQI